MIPNGERIAYRGKPGTPQAKTWISMKAGYEARDDDRDGIAGIEIRIHGIRVN